MMGMRKPVHILQLDASVDEIVNMTAVAVIDAQAKRKKTAINAFLQRVCLNFVLKIILLHLRH